MNNRNISGQLRTNILKLKKDKETLIRDFNKTQELIIKEIEKLRNIPDDLFDSKDIANKIKKNIPPKETVGKMMNAESLELINRINEWISDPLKASALPIEEHN